MVRYRRGIKSRDTAENRTLFPDFADRVVYLNGVVVEIRGYGPRYYALQAYAFTRLA
jgi:hypothetical protein